jgi:hypothetical protein
MDALQCESLVRRERAARSLPPNLDLASLLTLATDALASGFRAAVKKTDRVIAS